MTYQQTLDYLFTKLPMYSRIGAAAFKEDLTNTLLLCKTLGNPENKLRCIHIAGTNGKGSTSHLLAAVFQMAGYKTGLYTSPHLKDFRERIKINGEMISEDFVVDFVARMQEQILSIEPSFFEITVAMALDYFAMENVDIAIIEVGLGGRLDSTNVIHPELAVITNIGWDHMNMLGDSLEKIAFEKAGIIKKNIPVVLGEVLPVTKPVFLQKAAAESADLIIATEQFYVSDWHHEKKSLAVTVANKRNDERQEYHLDLTGIYQIKNILTVLAAIHQLRSAGWNLPEKLVKDGLSNAARLTGLHGRWEVIQSTPLLVLDVGHNEDGIKQLTEQIELTYHENLHLVIGLVKDKDIQKVLALLPKQAIYYFTKAQIPRALPEEQLAAMGASFGLQGASYPTVNAALAAALQHAREKDLVLVCGSVFVVGEVVLP